MTGREAFQSDSVFDGIAQCDNAAVVGYALESFAERIDNSIQNELLRNLILSHSEIAGRLEKTVDRLKESEERLNEAQQIAMLGRWDIDYVSGKQGWSRSLNRILGVDESTVGSTQLFLQFIHPDDREKVEGILLELLTQKESWVARYRLLLKDGSIRWVQARLITEFDLKGSPTRSYGTLQDITALKQTEDELERYNKHLEEMVSEKVRQISEAQMATIYALVKLAESRDDDTGAHIERTASYCRLLAQKARALPEYEGFIDEEYITTIHRASPLHDIGKVGISDAILLKPGKLTAEEFAVMKTHVEIGYRTLKSVETRYQSNSFVKMGLEITRYHHEKWDGSGYLAELKGNAIPLSARIMALSDVYDALRSRRIYKEPYSHEKSLEIIREGRGKHFDPVLTDLFLANDREFEALYDALS
ncbi:MAG: HD domain-containing protein [Eubacteriales bacterium]|nr:HD domain-containing protein [Eubacteriales bacterium]